MLDYLLEHYAFYDRAGHGPIESIEFKKKFGVPATIVYKISPYAYSITVQKGYPLVYSDIHKSEAELLSRFKEWILKETL